MIRSNPLREIKRVVGQFFETEYWYRWRHETYKYVNGYGKNCKETTFNAFRLANTWDGPDAMYRYFDIKLSHMLYNLKWNCDESKSYIDGGAIAAYGNKADELLIWKRTLQSLKDICHHKINKNEFFCDEFFYQDCTNYVYDKKSIKNGAHLNIAGVTLCWDKHAENRNIDLVYITEFDGYDLGSERELWYLIEKGNDVLKYETDDIAVKTVKSIKKFGKVINDFNKYQFLPIPDPTNPNVIKKHLPEWTFEDFTFAQHTFDIDIADYKKFSKDLMCHIRGAIPKVRSIWTFRKMLRDYHKFVVELMDNTEHTYDEALEKENLTERYKTFDEITQREIYDKMYNKLCEIARYFADNSQHWYD